MTNRDIFWNIFSSFHSSIHSVHMRASKTRAFEFLALLWNLETGEVWFTRMPRSRRLAQSDFPLRRWGRSSHEYGWRILTAMTAPNYGTCWPVIGFTLQKWNTVFQIYRQCNQMYNRFRSFIHNVIYLYLVNLFVSSSILSEPWVLSYKTLFTASIWILSYFITFTIFSTKSICSVFSFNKFR